MSNVFFTFLSSSSVTLILVSFSWIYFSNISTSFLILAFYKSNFFIFNFELIILVNYFVFQIIDFPTYFFKFFGMFSEGYDAMAEFTLKTKLAIIVLHVVFTFSRMTLSFSQYCRFRNSCFLKHEYINLQ